MKNFGMIGIITAMALALAVGGCASTSESKAPVYPELKVLSDKTYVWDDSISEALNVARMAEPAGVGVGMRDFADGTKANTGRVGAGEQVFDSAIGLAGMGVFGVLSMGVLNSEVNSLVDWQPSFVFLVPTTEITVSGRYDLKKAQVHIGTKIKDALEKSINDLEWYGVYTRKAAGSNENALYAINTSQCHNSIKQYYVDAKNAPYKATKFGSGFFEVQDFKEYCAVSLKLNISGFSVINNIKHAIVVGEVVDGHYFLDLMKSKIDGYMLFPESFTIPTIDSRSGKTLGYPYAYAIKNGSELKFQK